MIDILVLQSSGGPMPGKFITASIELAVVHVCFLLHPIEHLSQKYAKGHEIRMTRRCT